MHSKRSPAYYLERGDIIRIEGNGIEVTRTRQLKRNVVMDGVWVVTLLPIWNVTFSETVENVNKLQGLMGILNLIIKIHDPCY